MIIRPITARDIGRFWPPDWAPRGTVRAICVEDAGIILGVCGIVYEDRRCKAFVDIQDEIPLRVMVKARAELMRIIRGAGCVVYAVGHNRHALERVGFRRVVEIPDEEVYRWHR